MEYEGLLKLRKGFLYLIVAAVMLFAGLVMGLVSLFYVLAMPGAVFHGTSVVFSTLAALASILLVSFVLHLYAVFSKIRGGYRDLSRVDKGFGICYSGTTLMLVGLVIAIIGALALIAFVASAMSAFPPGGPPPGGDVVAMFILPLGMVLLGLVLVFVGNILVYIIGAFKLNDRYKDSLFLAAGILYIIDLVLALLGLVGLLQFVGHIIMYVALGKAAEKLTTSAPSPATGV